MGKTWHHGRYNWKKSPRGSTRLHHLLHGEIWWTQKEPKWWRKMTKHRPRRAKEKFKVAQIFNGADPEDMVWPLDGKPWIYYW